MRVRLKEIRESKGMKQSQVADAIGEQLRTYGSWERMERGIPVESVVKLADYFGVSVDYLLGLTDIPNIYARPTDTGADIYAPCDASTSDTPVASVTGRMDDMPKDAEELAAFVERLILKSKK